MELAHSVNHEQVPGGPYPAWATSILCVFDMSDSNNITGKQATHLGFMNRVQMRYPDGSTDTEVTVQGKLVNNEITGTWYDKFQHGEFGWTVRTATAP